MRAPGFSRRTFNKKRKDAKTLDLTEILTYCAVGFMLYRGFFLLRVMLFQPPTPKHYNNSNWLVDMKPKQVQVDYSKLKGVRMSSGRTFLKYSSSPWETKWSTSMDDFVKSGTVCNQISFDTDLIRKFFNATCTSMAQDEQVHKNHKGWCILDDTEQPLFFNVGSGKISGARPGPLKEVPFGPPQAVTIDLSDSPVFSKFIYRDEDTGNIVFEYVEPLISRLRHPLDCCEHAYKIGANFKKPPPNCFVTKRLGVSRTQYLPPSHTEGFEKSHFFDSSSVDWKRAKSALSYVSKVWKRHGIDFTHYHVYEGKVSNDKFMANVPEEKQPKIDYRPVQSGNRTDFVHEIVTQTSPDDYVLFKLDLDDPDEELRVFQELLDNRLNVLEYLDEFLYVIPIPPNITEAEMEYGSWYKRFLQLRQDGVRAHSFAKDTKGS